MMNDQLLLQQAIEIASLFPQVQRSLFALDADDPASELPVAQLRVCAVLRDGPHPMSVLSRELGISMSAMTQIADRMERAGLVERISEEGDRRVKTLQLTESGGEIMRARRERRISQVLHALEHLAPEMREEVIQALHHLLEAANTFHSGAQGNHLINDLAESA